MKRLPVLFMLFAVILTQTELHQFFKLLVVAEHYAEHMQENPRISFGDFLFVHYVQVDSEDEDHERDKQLPFKTSECASVLTTAVELPCNFYSICRPSHEWEIPFPEYVNDGVSSTHVADIWQPPRLV